MVLFFFFKWLISLFKIDVYFFNMTSIFEHAFTDGFKASHSKFAERTTGIICSTCATVRPPPAARQGVGKAVITTIIAHRSDGTHMPRRAPGRTFARLSELGSASVLMLTSVGGCCTFNLNLGRKCAVSRKFQPRKRKRINQTTARLLLKIAQLNQSINQILKAPHEHKRRHPSATTRDTGVLRHCTARLLLA